VLRVLLIESNHFNVIGLKRDGGLSNAVNQTLNMYRSIGIARDERLNVGFETLPLINCSDPHFGRWSIGWLV